MQSQQGINYDFDEFKKLLNKQDPECEGAFPVVEGATTGTMVRAEEKDLPEIKKAMKEAGWNRHERRKYLSQLRKGRVPDRWLEEK